VQGFGYSKFSACVFARNTSAGFNSSSVKPSFDIALNGSQFDDEFTLEQVLIPTKALYAY
jgi:hypothetical protein